MSSERHGFSIGIERQNSHFFLTLKALGKLSHEDCLTITPMLDAALAGVRKPSIDVFLDVTELEGWEARAAWDDFKLGLKHGSKFNQIAILGNRKWQEKAARLASWFISGEAKFFTSETEALAWLEPD